MSEYVEKEAAINRLRDQYEYEHPTGSGEFDEYACHEVPRVILNMKPADVKPVVYCRECRYAENTVTGECKYCAYWGDMFQTFSKLYLRADFFCAAGERRKE